MGVMLDNRASSIPFFAYDAVAVSPDNSNDLARTKAAIYVGTGGDIKVDMHDVGTAIIFKNVPSGTFLPILVDRVYVADTSADDILALYA